MMGKDQVIEKLLESAGHGTRREDIEAAYAAGVSAERQRWVTLLRSWVIEAERESGPETAGWLELAIERLGD